MARRIALLIGNQTFVDKEHFPALYTPANDVEDFAKALKLYSNFTVLEKHVDEDAETIRGAIEDLYSQAERGDLTLLYYSGHGYKDKTGRLYLIAQNTQTARILTTGVKETFIKEAMSYCRSRHRVVILDCCFNGEFIKGYKSGSEPLLLEELKGEATAILASSSRIQYSFQEKTCNSLFTHYILRGINTGQADEDEDGWIAIEELFGYVDPMVRGKRPEQTPIIEIKARESKIIIAKNPKSPNLNNSLPDLGMCRDTVSTKPLSPTIHRVGVTRTKPPLPVFTISIPGEIDPAQLKADFTELTRIYLTDIPSFTLMYRPQSFHTVNESVWTNFPHQGDGTNPPFPPLDLTDGWSIAGLYNITPVKHIFIPLIQRP